jgi:tripartite-type tricarboxylate transporter receptor subunit TctC
LRAIAVASSKRSRVLPELPTIAESGVPGFDATSWNGMLAPAGTSKEIIARLNAEYNRLLADPEISKRMIEIGYEPIGGPPEKFGEFIHAEIVKWAPVVKAVGLKVN